MPVARLFVMRDTVQLLPFAPAGEGRKQWLTTGITEFLTGLHS